MHPPTMRAGLTLLLVWAVVHRVSPHESEPDHYRRGLGGGRQLLDEGGGSDAAGGGAVGVCTGAASIDLQFVHVPKVGAEVRCRGVRQTLGVKLLKPPPLEAATVRQLLVRASASRRRRAGRLL